MKKHDNVLPVHSFESAGSLRKWLSENHAESDGIRVRTYKKSSGIRSVTFEEVLDEGLCFGWSESMKRKCDDKSYLQRFTPRHTKGTTSGRNREHIRRLIKEKRMMPSGLLSLGTDKNTIDY